MKIEEEQENLLKLANNYILRMQDKGIDVSTSTFCYLNAQEVTPGYCKLKNLQFNRKFSFQYIFTTVKHLLSVATLHNFEEIEESNHIQKKFVFHLNLYYLFFYIPLFPNN